MKKLIIIGAGGFGREVYEWASDSAACGRDWTIKGYIDDAPPSRLRGTLKVPLLGRICEYKISSDEVFVFGVGAPAVRSQIYSTLIAAGALFVSIIHPTATVCSTACIEAGVVICPYALVSADAVIGVGSVVYYHSSVDHDARIGRFCQISGHCDVTGGAILGEQVFLGSHAIILPGIVVGDRAIVGAGAVVAEDLGAGTIAYGVPARPRLLRSVQEKYL